MFLLLFCLLLTWRPLEQYGASSHPMAASSGFLYSSGHAAFALGDAACIASMCQYGHQIGMQQRYICLLPSPFLFAINIDKDYVIVNVN
jgi:hypothetical protein